MREGTKGLSSNWLLLENLWPESIGLCLLASGFLLSMSAKAQAEQHLTFALACSDIFYSDPSDEVEKERRLR